MTNAILKYAKARYKEQCEAVQMLPRELRDMIYAFLAQVQGTVPGAGECSHHGFIDNITMFHGMHFLDSDFVGKATAEEIAQVFYKINTFFLLSCFQVKAFLNDKTLHGVVARDHVRAMKVEIPNRALVSRDHHGDVDSCEGHNPELLDHTVEQLQEAVREILNVKHPRGFKLELVLSDNADRDDFDDDRIKSIMLALVPVYADLENQGFEVTVTLRDAEDHFHMDDLTIWLDSEPEEWDDILEDYRQDYYGQPFDFDDDMDGDFMMGFPSMGIFGTDFRVSSEEETSDSEDDDEDDDDLPGLE
jgi:hypothetical protein